VHELAKCPVHVIEEREKRSVCLVAFVDVHALRTVGAMVGPVSFCLAAVSISEAD